MSQYLIRNVSLVDDSVVDIEISNGLITKIGSSLESTALQIDGSGMVALAGFVDLHTHLREPGFEESETVLTGSRAAARGGYTAIHPMANTNPVADNAAVVEQVHNLGIKAGYVQVQPIGAVTKGLEGKQLAELHKMNVSEAKVTVFSDDGKCVSDSLLMRRALEYVKPFGGIIAQHAQDPALTVNAQMNEGALATKLGLSGWPATAESGIIARDCLLAGATGSRLHVCHVSTKSAVDVIRWAKSRGINVTAEVTPHHLLLTEDLAKDYNALYKVNPPLRTFEDVVSVREALADGTIDIVATDHAPHPAENKTCAWGEAAFGMLGLETAASVVYTVMVKSGLMNLKRFQEVMSLAPAVISGVEGQGQELVERNVANVVLLNLNAKYDFSLPSESKSSNNPFVGQELYGKVEHVFYRGIQTVKNGAVVDLENK